MLKFQKVKDSRIGLEYDWLLVIENEDDLWNYHETTFGPMVESAWDNLLQVKNGKAHINTDLGFIINFRTKSVGDSLLVNTAKVLDDIHFSRLNLVKKYGKIFINKRGGYFTPHKDIIVTDEILLKNKGFRFPEYKESDIKLRQWKGGTHWYAKIGNIDVVDEDGNVKWDTLQEARIKAKEFLKTI